ncbi:hypothetical protein cco106_05206 [Campylobacter coli 2553]|nr:hypothetical protein cco106_05206 [Campylobacter coli 2553]
MPIGSTFYIFFKKAKEPKNKDFSIISPKYRYFIFLLHFLVYFFQQ